MKEQPPELPNKTPMVERGPIAYEQALESLRSLYAAGTVDPLDLDNPTVLSALDVVDAWEYDVGLPERGISTPEKAVDMVRAAKLFIDAGYTDPQFIRDALERLNGEYADALRAEGNDEIRMILGTALQDLEKQLVKQNPKESVADVIEGRLTLAKQKMEDGDLMDAVRTLLSTLFHPDYKRYFADFPEKREEVIQLKSKIEEAWKGIATPLRSV